MVDQATLARRTRRTGASTYSSQGLVLMQQRAKRARRRARTEISSLPPNPPTVEKDLPQWL
jgi:hypothetical protein